MVLAPLDTGPQTGQPGLPQHPPSPIAHQRFLLRLSQAQLAERARLSRETISRLERGEIPRLDTAIAVADALGVDFASLFLNEEGRSPDKGTAFEMPGGQARYVGS